jgi:hypothetical protein
VRDFRLKKHDMQKRFVFHFRVDITQPAKGQGAPSAAIAARSEPGVRSPVIWRASPDSCLPSGASDMHAARRAMKFAD